MNNKMPAFSFRRLTNNKHTEPLFDSLYNELDGVVCCCMAAGVSSDRFIITHSIDKVIMEVDGVTSIKGSCHIGFKPADSD